MKYSLISLLSVSVLIGCGNSTGSELTIPTPKSTTGPSSDASPSSTDRGKPMPTAPSVSLSDVPDVAKTDAYRYFGLSNDKPLKLEMAQTGEGTLTGSLKNTLTSVKDGQAFFDVDYGDGLESKMGSNSVRADKDGVHAVSMSLGKMAHEDLELPAKLSPGTTWTSHNSIEVAGGEAVKQDITYKVVGLQDVQSKGAKYSQALYVVGTGTIVAGKAKSQVTERAWYVKDKGPVKQTIDQKVGNQAPKSITIQETK